jgi:hypothetical protein
MNSTMTLNIIPINIVEKYKNIIIIVYIVSFIIATILLNKSTRDFFTRGSIGSSWLLSMFIYVIFLLPAILFISVIIFTIIFIFEKINKQSSSSIILKQIYMIIYIVVLNTIGFHIVLVLTGDPDGTYTTYRYYSSMFGNK